MNFYEFLLLAAAIPAALPVISKLSTGYWFY